jgi:hypothetical protein
MVTPMACFSMPLPRSVLCLAIPAALALVACGSPVVGSWQSDLSLNPAPPWGSRNKLTVESDLTGEARIYATPSNDHTAWTSLKFELEGQELDDGITWKFAMSCVSEACNGDDFRMECKVIDTGADLYKMKCDGNHKWVSYPFDWEEVEE